MAINEEEFGEMKSDIKWIREKLEGADGKYAARWVQHVTTFTMSTVGVALIGALLGLILINPTRAFFLTTF